MDPHKRSVTIEVMAADEAVRDGGRFGTDRAGYRAMLTCAQRWPNRVWAIEGCQGIGRHVALRLLRDGEDVVDVPPKLSARARVFATGHGRKTDATDAHSVALVWTDQTKGSRARCVEGQTPAPGGDPHTHSCVDGCGIGIKTMTAACTRRRARSRPEPAPRWRLFD
jgi:hypothetical protein